MRLGYFQRRWVRSLGWQNWQEWIDEARTRFIAFYWQYRDEYMNSGPGAAVVEVAMEEDVEEKVSALSEWKFNRNIPLRREVNEAEEYLNGEVEMQNIDPREWWKINESRFPVLAYMAWNILSIPAISAEVERAFSG